jgi:hypothetical protein
MPKSGGTLMKLPLAGGTPTTLLSGQRSPSGIAVDATSNWTNLGTYSNFTDGSVMKLTPK